MKKTLCTALALVATMMGLAQAQDRTDPLEIGEIRKLQRQDMVVDGTILNALEQLRKSKIGPAQVLDRLKELKPQKTLEAARALHRSDLQQKLILALESETRRLAEIRNAARVEVKRGETAAAPEWKREAQTGKEYQARQQAFQDLFYKEWNAIPDGAVYQSFPVSAGTLQLVAYHAQIEADRSLCGQLVLRDKHSNILYRGPKLTQEGFPNGDGPYFGPLYGDLQLVGALTSPGRTQFITRPSERGGPGQFEIREWNGKGFPAILSGYLGENTPGSGQFDWKLVGNRVPDVGISRFIAKEADGSFWVQIRTDSGADYARVRANADGFR